MTLTEFLLARIAEDEDAARRASGSHWIRGVERGGSPGRYQGVVAELVCLPGDQFSDLGATVASMAMASDSAHIARWDPARVLVECEAKRRIVEHLGGDRSGVGDPVHPILRLLALPHADHPAYDPAWSPQ